MKKSLILIQLLLLGCGNHKEPESDLTNIVKGQIIDGEKTGSGQFMSVIKVRSARSLCTGTIIHPYLVLTAAHCVDSNPTDLTVEFEGYLNGWPVAPVTVKKYFYHEGYEGNYESERFAQDDVAILVLSTPIMLPSNAIIRPLTQFDHYDDDENITIAGFGLNSEEKKSGYKRYKTVDIASTLFCDTPEGHIRLDEAGNSGDSGGPSFVQIPGGQWRQLAVTSLRMMGRYWGMFCKGTSVVDIRAYEDWLIEKVGFDPTYTDLEITEEIKARFF